MAICLLSLVLHGGKVHYNVDNTALTVFSAPYFGNMRPSVYISL